MLRKILFLTVFLFFQINLKSFGIPESSSAEILFDSLESIISSGNPDISNILYSKLAQARENGDSISAARACYVLGKFYLVTTFNYPRAYNLFLQALSNFDRLNNVRASAKCNMQIGLIYYLQRNFNEALTYFNSSYKTMALIGDSMRAGRLSYLLSLVYSEKKDFDNALYYLRITKKYSSPSEEKSQKLELSYGMGMYYLNKGYGDSALIYLNPLINDTSLSNTSVKQRIFANIARAWWLKGHIEKADYYAKKAISINNNINIDHNYISSFYLLYQIAIKKDNYQQAVNYLNKYIQLRDSVLDEKNLFEIASLKMKYSLERTLSENELINDREKADQQAIIARQKGLKNIFIAGSIFSLIIVEFLFYSNHIKKKKNEQLAHSLEKLKSTQEQLIHNEKLVSMGKLSTGIAHEMRNPLNFVNNFSEVSLQIIDEMEEIKSEEERAIYITTLKKNISMISQHGKRAENIVRHIIEHVQSAPGSKSPTDINQLCDIYLKMVLHNMSVHKLDYNHQIVKNYSEGIPLVSVNPHELGRVFMNILSNSFLAIEEKLQIKTFAPIVKITTGMLNSMVFVEFNDNGIGIKKENLTKIVDPFFTTHSAGKGAGLGLSVAHDIIRSYGGNITAHSILSEYTTIRVELPS